MRYNQAIPDAAERILRMAEGQAQHRQKMEWMALSSDSRRAYWGLVTGLVVALAFLAGSVWLGLTGHDQLAGVLGGSTVLGLVAVFVTGTIGRRRERQEKAKAAEDLQTVDSTAKRSSKQIRS